MPSYNLSNWSLIYISLEFEVEIFMSTVQIPELNRFPFIFNISGWLDSHWTKFWVVIGMDFWLSVMVLLIFLVINIGGFFFNIPNIKIQHIQAY